MANYTVSNVTANKTLAVVFSTSTSILLGLKSQSDEGKCSIRYKIDSGSWTTISSPTYAGTTISVPAGSELTVEAININSAKKFKNWVGMMGSQPIAFNNNPQTINSATVERLQGIDLELEDNTFTITTTKNPSNGGTISPENPTVPYGGSQTFQVTPASGYRIESVTLDGTPIEPDS